MIVDKQRFIDDLLSLTERNPPVRWLHQGRDPATGLDCIGALRFAYMKQQGPLPEGLEREFDAYLRRPNGDHFLSVMREWFDEADRSERQAADLLVIYDRKNPQHMAVAVNETEVFEMYCNPSAGVGKALRQKLDSRRVVAAVFRFPESGEKADKWQSE